MIIGALQTSSSIYTFSANNPIIHNYDLNTYSTMKKFQLQLLKFKLAGFLQSTFLLVNS